MRSSKYLAPNSYMLSGWLRRICRFTGKGTGRGQHILGDVRPVFWEPRFGNRDLRVYAGSPRTRGQGSVGTPWSHTHLARKALRSWGNPSGMVNVFWYRADIVPNRARPSLHPLKMGRFRPPMRDSGRPNRSIAYRSPGYDLTSRPHGASRRDLPRLWREGTPRNLATTEARMIFGPARAEVGCQKSQAASATSSR